MAVHLIVQPIPGKPHDLHARLHQVATRLLSKNASKIPPGPSFESRIVQTAVGPDHIALLFEDGNVCRMKYEIDSSNLDGPTEGGGSSGGSSGGGGGPSAGDGGGGGGGRRAQEMYFRQFMDQAHARAAGRGAAPQRVSAMSYFGAVSGGGRSARRSVPSSAVPDDVVQRLQEILPDKSRQVIIRTLQRTGLDVDAAVNSLLMSDDNDDGGEGDEPAGVAVGGASGGGGAVASVQDPYLMASDAADLFLGHPQGYEVVDEADVMGVGAPVDDSEPLLGMASASVLVGSIGRSGPPHASYPSPLMQDSLAARLLGDRERQPERSRDRDRERERERLRERERILMRQTRSPREQFERGELRLHSRPSASEPAPEPKPGADGKERATIDPGKVAYKLVGKPEWWHETAATAAPNERASFRCIGGLHSMLLAVSADGSLYSWPWAEGEGKRYPRAGLLGLGGEVISHLACCNIRASVLTESGKMATLMDSSVSVPPELGGPAQPNEPEGLRPLEHAATMFPCFASDRVVSLDVSEYTTAVVTSSCRLFHWGTLPCHIRERIVEQAKQKRKQRSDAPLVHPGDEVVLRSCPMYRPGAVGFTVQTGRPRIGKLLDTAWDVADKCRFRLAAGHIEEWRLDEVVIVHQGSGAQVGRVLKVDGPHAAVYFPEAPGDADATNTTPSTGPPAVPELTAAMWQSSRLFRTDELACTSDDSLTIPLLPKCTQDTPRRIRALGSVVAAAVTHDCVQYLARADGDDGANTLTFVCYSFTDASFCDHTLRANPDTFRDNVRLFSGFESSTLLLRDNTNTLYPVLDGDDCAGKNNAPQWNNLPPLVSASAGVKAVSRNGKPTRLAILCLCLEEPRLSLTVLDGSMPAIKKAIAALKDASRAEAQQAAQELVDGSRNVLHLMATKCSAAPPSARRPSSSSRSEAPAMSVGQWVECIEELLAAEPLEPYLPSLLSRRNVQGRTPFMLAIKLGAFRAASAFLQCALRLQARGLADIKDNVGLRDSVMGDSPLHAMYQSPICTYARCGPAHITQEVFECVTCHMTDKLVVCAACARQCHLGHEVRSKGVAPSAYCDCKEFKHCVLSPPAGDNQDRRDLFSKLKETSLVSSRNADGDTALLSLLVAPSLGVGRGKSSKAARQEDIEQAKVLEALASDWTSVKTTLLVGHRAISLDHSAFDFSFDETHVGDSNTAQDCTAKLDRVVHHLLTTSQAQACRSFVETTVKAINREPVESLPVVSRFVRSVVRVFMVLSSDPLPAQDREQGASGSAEGYSHSTESLRRCRRIFHAFKPLAVQELVENADAILAPVRLGLVRPFSAFVRDQDLEASRTGTSRTHPPVATVFGSPWGLDAVQARSRLGVGSPGNAHLGHDSESEDDDDDAMDDDVPSRPATPPGHPAMDQSMLDWAIPSHVLAGPGVRGKESAEPSGGGGGNPPGFGRTSYQPKYYGEGTPTAAQQAPAPELIASSMDYLTRSYLRLVHQLVDTLTQPPIPVGLADPVMDDAQGLLLRQAINVMEAQMERSWSWLCSNLDALEAQLHTGACYLQTTTPAPEDAGAAVVEAVSKKQLQKDAQRNRRLARHATQRREQEPVPKLDSVGIKQYLLSLMRAHSGEHGDTLPAVDVSRCRHLAYVLDAFMYYLRTRMASIGQGALRSYDKQQAFFLRTESIVAGGSVAAPVFTTPMSEALPLAERPDRLHPRLSRTAMFGAGEGTGSTLSPAHLPPTHLGLSSRLSASFNDSMSSSGAVTSTPHKPEREGGPSVPTTPMLSPTRMDESSFASHFGGTSVSAMHVTNVPILHDFVLDAPPLRWRMLLSLFGRLFLSDVGAERDSFLAELAGFKLKEVRVREAMDAIKRNSSFDFKLDVPRERNELLLATYKQVEHQAKQRRKNGGQVLACRRVQVQFRDEPGEGSGVARAFYATICEALLDDAPLPALPPVSDKALSIAKIMECSKSEKRQRLMELVLGACVQETGDMANATTLVSSLIESEEAMGRTLAKLMVMDARTLVRQELGLGEANKKRDSAEDKATADREEAKADAAAASGEERDDSDRNPLFFCPGKPGFSSPRFGKRTEHRLGWYRLIGRLAGLCLLHNDILALTFSRHVLKFLLGRQVGWHDLAFFDPELYENMRKLIVEASRMPAEDFASLSLAFSVDLRPELGGGSVELLPGGKDMAVTPDNVHQYIELHAQLLMVKSIEPELKAMKSGLLDVVDLASLQGLMAEDLRLLLNGCPAIDVALLKKCTTFVDESGKAEGLESTRKWFWQVVERMSDRERSDLVYFWTSSPGVPATEAGFVPKPSVVVRPPSDDRLPTANTCVSRLSVPLYPSRKVLQGKLLKAIQTRVFGFV